MDLDPCYEFEAPKFCDFTKQADIDEAYCQDYFDKKAAQVSLNQQHNLSSQKIQQLAPETVNSMNCLPSNSVLPLNFDATVCASNQANPLTESSLQNHNNLMETKSRDANKCNGSTTSSHASNASKDLQNGSKSCKNRSHRLSHISHVSQTMSQTMPSMNSTNSLNSMNSMNNSMQNWHGGSKRLMITSEELELQEMARQRELVKQQMKRNSKNVSKMREQHNVMEPIRSLKLTIPQTPALMTEQRASQREKKSSAFAAFVAQNQKQTMRRPKSASPSHNIKERKKLTATVVEPFHLETERRAELRKQWMQEHGVDVYEPSEVVFGTIGTNKENEHVHNRQKPLKLTVPQSFKLSKSKSYRDNLVSTEDMVLHDAEQHQFRARKLNPKLFENDSGNLGVPAVKPKPLTIPHSMKLRTKQRALLYAKYGSHHSGIGPKAAHTYHTSRTERMELDTGPTTSRDSDRSVSNVVTHLKFDDRGSLKETE